MARLFILGATGSLGRQVTAQALAALHRVTVLVRTPEKLVRGAGAHISVHAGDLNSIAPAELAELVRGHDTLINCAGHVSDGERFVDLVDRVVTAVELLPSKRPVCWFLAGAALLDLDPSGRRGVDLPKVGTSYWPHRVNFERLSRSSLDWRLLCPGPMVEQPALGLGRLRTSRDALPLRMPVFVRALPSPLLLPLFAAVVPSLIVPYADAAALMLAEIEPGSDASRRRVGVALPAGMRGRKPRWTAQAARARNADRSSAMQSAARKP